jgi:hypothetical protein
VARQSLAPAAPDQYLGGRGPGARQGVSVAALLDGGCVALAWRADGVPKAETLARVGITKNDD